jgi:hypothetical protein
MNHAKSYVRESLAFFALEINILCRNVFILCIHYIYTLKVHMSTSDIVIYYIHEVVIPPTPRKYNVLNGNFVFDLCDIFQEHNAGIQRRLPVYRLLM